MTHEEKLALCGDCQIRVYGFGIPDRIIPGIIGGAGLIFAIAATKESHRAEFAWETVKRIRDNDGVFDLT